MFNKLLSNLSFNPSLIGQVSFYAKRLHEEASVRRLGFIFVSLVMLIQMFAIFSPAQPTLARSADDIIPGGFASKEQAVQHCQNNNHDFAVVLRHFSISCTDIANTGEVKTLRSTDENNQFYTVGRQSQGPINPATNKTTDEGSLAIGNRTYYSRKLSSKDSGKFSSYKALSIRNSSGKQYHLLFSCGDVVHSGKPDPAPPVAKPLPPTPKPQPTPPALDVCSLIPGAQANKSDCLPCPQSQSDQDVGSCLVPTKKAKNVTKNLADANGTTAQAGDIITYSLALHNSSKVATQASISENLSDVLEYADITDTNGAASSTDGTVSWGQESIAPGATISHHITVKIKSPVPQTPSPCPANSVVTPCPRSSSFDLTMTNSYGNTVNVKLPATLAKTTEQASNRLPDTGPGPIIILSFGLFSFVGYFFARSRLLAKELDIVRSEYTTSGGL